MAFLLASTRPSSTKILLVKSLTGPSSRKWILESSVFGSVGTPLLTKIGVTASVAMSTIVTDSVVIASVVVVVVVVVVAVVVVGTLGRTVVVGAGSSVVRSSASVLVTISFASPPFTSSVIPEPKMVLTASKISS